MIELVSVSIVTFPDTTRKHSGLVECTWKSATVPLITRNAGVDGHSHAVISRFNVEVTGDRQEREKRADDAGRPHRLPSWASWRHWPELKDRSFCPLTCVDSELFCGAGDCLVKRFMPCVCTISAIKRRVHKEITARAIIRDLKLERERKGSRRPFVRAGPAAVRMACDQDSTTRNAREGLHEV